MGRSAIINGFGRTLGDSIIGLQALSVAIARGSIAPRPTLFRLPGLSPIIAQAYEAAADLAEVAELPWEDATRERPFAPTATFSQAIDMRDFAFDPAFRCVAMIDYFLRCLGVDPASVPPAERRNSWLAPRMPEKSRGGYVLVCPRTSSALRNMPDEVHAHILAWLTRHTGAEVLTQATLAPADTLDALCSMVAGARLIVSADTAMVHLADAFSTPCLAFFTSHRPEWRVRDYPRCHAEHLRPVGLPEALELVRDDADIAASRGAWFARGADLAWLDKLLANSWKGSAA
ncbi:MAG: glycosyltransferase family 9 protein [Betaproteobacteria bacterium]